VLSVNAGSKRAMPSRFGAAQARDVDCLFRIVVRPPVPSHKRDESAMFR
jgi:hypothetical protein